MRAKLQVTSVTPSNLPDGTPQQERVTFAAVCGPSFDAAGLSEDNTFAKRTPAADLSMTITNPAIFGTLVVGEKYYLDFTKAEG